MKIKAVLAAIPSLSCLLLLEDCARRIIMDAVWWVTSALILACGCGRIGFGAVDLTDGANDDVTSAGENGTCATANDVAVGTSLTNQTVDATDDVSTLAICPSGPDVVYRLTLAASTDVSITALATFNGVISTSNQCPPTLLGQSSCYTMTESQSFQRAYTFAPGITYIIVDKLLGSGTTFDIAVE